MEDVKSFLEMISGSRYFLGRGWGMLRTRPTGVYELCRQRRLAYTVVRDGYREQNRDVLTQHFEKLLNMTSQPEMLGREQGPLIIDAQSVYRYFLRIHEHAIGRGSSGIVRDYRFTEVLFIELDSHIGYVVEYLLLLFKYLLCQGLPMPQLFVVCDYPTSIFDFIESDIMGIPITKWWIGSDNANWFRTGEPDPETMRAITTISSIRPETYALGHIQTLKERLGRDKAVCVVVSANSYYENHLAKELEGLEDFNPVFYEDADAYHKTPPQRGAVGILLLKSATDLLQDVFDRVRPTVVVLDTRFKAGVNMLYAGNVLMPVRPNSDWIRSVIWRLQRDRPGTSVLIYDEGKDPVARTIFIRSPIIDYMQMRMFKVDMLLLYTNYYEGTAMKSFLSVVRAEASTLRTLHFEDRDRLQADPVSRENSAFVKCVLLGIHPMFISLIESWCRYQIPDGAGGFKKLPRVPILVFVAVMLGTDKQIVEIKEHGTREHESDVSQTSLYGQALFRYLQLMETHRSVVMEEGGRTARLLKRLLEAYTVREDEMLLFDHNVFTQHLTRIILDDYQPFVLTQHSLSVYHGRYNNQMNWQVMQGTNLPERILPLSVSMGATRRRVLLFVPLNRV